MRGIPVSLEFVEQCELLAPIIREPTTPFDLRLIRNRLAPDRFDELAVIAFAGGGPLEQSQ